MFTNLVVKFALWLYTRKNLKHYSFDKAIIGFEIQPKFKYVKIVHQPHQ